MALALATASSQYVSFPNGTNWANVRPLTVAILINTASLADGTEYGLISEGNSSSTDGAGWNLRRTLTTNLIQYQWMPSATVNRSVSSTNTVLANTGWWLIAAVHRVSGANSAIGIFTYQYSTGTLTISTGSSTTGAPFAPGATHPGLIGALYRSSALQNYYNGQIGWSAVFSADLGNAESSTAPGIWELIVRGPWGLLDSNCKFFMPFSNTAQDVSGGGYSATLINAPVYVGSGPVEPFPAAIFPRARQAAVQNIANAGDIGSAEALGAPQINQNIAGAGNVVSGEAFGVPGITLTIVPGSIASAEALGLPTANLNIQTAGGIASTEAFGAPIVANAGSPQTISGAGGIASGEAWGIPQASLTIAGAGAIVPGEVFGVPGIMLTLIGGGIASGEAFGGAAVTSIGQGAFGTAALSLTQPGAALLNLIQVGIAALSLTQAGAEPSARPNHSPAEGERP